LTQGRRAAETAEPRQINILCLSAQHFLLHLQYPHKSRKKQLTGKKKQETEKNQSEQRQRQNRSRTDTRDWRASFSRSGDDKAAF